MATAEITTTRTTRRDDGEANRLASREAAAKIASAAGNALLANESEAAGFLGLTPRTLAGWRHAGGGPPYVRISSRCIRYRISDLEAFAAARMTTSTSAAE